MIQLFGVVNSDRITRNNFKFPITTLESAYAEGWDKFYPSYKNHDRLKPLGQIKLRSLYLEPGLMRTTNTIEIPETNTEFQRVKKNMDKHFDRIVTETSKDSLEKLRSKVAPHLSQEYKITLASSVAIIDKGIVKRLFPDLIDSESKHIMVDYNKLEYVMPGIFKKDGLILYVHEYFRRSFSRLNTLNKEFLKVFHDFSLNSDANIKIAIDEDMIGLLGTEKEEFEFQYWWGPKFNDDLTSIPSGVTVHKNSDRAMSFNDISKTEFFWYEQDGKKTLECEEVIEVPNLDIENELIGCRYIHSMIPNELEEEVHLDGAVRIYDIEKMLYRQETTLDNTRRDNEYRKLWRIDGDIEVSKWKELITHYYRDNMLVGEYFEGVDDVLVDEIEEIIPKSDTSPVDEFIPYNLTKESGIRLAVSYDHLTKYHSSDNQVIKIRPTKMISFKNKMRKYVELETYELIKEYRKLNVDLIEPISSTLKVSYEDTNFNFPVLIHSGKDSVQNANSSLNLLLSICEKLERMYTERLITFTIAIDYSTKNVKYSVGGHIKDVIKWLSDPVSQLPNNESEIGDWLENQSQFLRTYGEADDNPKIGSILSPNGIVSFDRTFVDGCNFKMENNHLVGTFTVPNSESLIKTLEDRELNFAPVFLVNSSKCTKYGCVYQDCSCSKLTDLECGESMTDIKLLGAFYTNRHASL